MKRNKLAERSRTLDSFGVFLVTLNAVGWATLLIVVWTWWRL